MPYSMPWGEQKDRWFTVLLFISLPFYVFFRIIKGDLPNLKDATPENPTGKK